jgi:hypothetical protein
MPYTGLRKPIKTFKSILDPRIYRIKGRRADHPVATFGKKKIEFEAEII